MLKTAEREREREMVCPSSRQLSTFLMSSYSIPWDTLDFGSHAMHRLEAQSTFELTVIKEERRTALLQVK